MRGGGGSEEEGGGGRRGCIQNQNPHIGKWWEKLVWVLALRYYQYYALFVSHISIFPDII